MNSIPWMAELSHALAELQRPDADRAQYLLRSGSMRVGLYAPTGSDPQTCHTQDEVYIVLQGHGVFEKDRVRVPFKAHDVLFVEAGVSHRFLDFSFDFATWVVFWGPPGGETSNQETHHNNGERNR